MIGLMNEYVLNEMHPEDERISQSTVSRIGRTYKVCEHIREVPGSPRINQNVPENVLSTFENPFGKLSGAIISKSKRTRTQRNICYWSDRNLYWMR